MKLWLASALAVVLPLIGLADGLATSVCILEKSQYEDLIKTTKDISKVSNADLWAASLKNTFVGNAPGETADLKFSHGGKTLVLHIHVREDKTLYAIRDVTAKGKETLVVSGEIAKGRETKETSAGEPFVVILRTGDFLKK